mmetsp:Transcript_26577/g.44432  ORF Transcript_26577/g.44432 Transcript_26577/m.44432 type:complete len:130 (+) Transcript_26577:64-453(+)
MSTPAGAVDVGLSKEWVGVHLTSTTIGTTNTATGTNGTTGTTSTTTGNCTTTEHTWEKQRHIVCGVVTSGQPPHTNQPMTVAIGFASVVRLNDMFTASYGMFPQPQAHRLVLFQNPQSLWLRPAVLRIM